MRPVQHILIVDDEEILVYTFGLYFELQGYRVSTACDGMRALEIASKDSIDAVITDFRMPGMNGVELISRLRHLKPQLPAVIVSGYPWEAIQGSSRIKVLTKPVEMSVLVATIEDLLNNAGQHGHDGANLALRT